MSTISNTSKALTVVVKTTLSSRWMVGFLGTFKAAMEGALPSRSCARMRNMKKDFPPTWAPSNPLSRTQICRMSFRLGTSAMTIWSTLKEAVVAFWAKISAFSSAAVV